MSAPLIKGTKLSLRETRNKGPFGVFGAEERAIFSECLLEIPENALTLIVGPSGSGKSLLASLIAGLMPVSGALRLSDDSSIKLQWPDEKEPHELLGPVYPPELRGQIGFLFQFTNLLDDLTVDQNLELACEHSMHRWKPAEWAEWREWLISHLQLSEHIHKRASQLSGGLVQRAGFARLVASAPRLMVFDEPTSALDATSGRKVANVIRELQDEGKKLGVVGALVITHDVRLFGEFADCIVMVADGKVTTTVLTDANRDVEIAAANRRLADFADAPRQAKSEPGPPRPYEPANAAQPAKSEPKEPKPTDWRPIKLRERWRRWWSRKHWQVGTLWDRSVGGVVDAFKHRIRFRWHARTFFHMVRLVGLEAFPFVLFASCMVGALLTYFGLTARIGAPELAIESIVAEDLVRGTGQALWSVIVPLFVAVFLAARSGAAVAGYLGSLTLSGQCRLLKSMGVSPARLYTPHAIVAFAITMPLLAYAGFWAAAGSSAITALLTRPILTMAIWKAEFFGAIGPGLLFAGWEWVLVRLITCAAGIAVVSCWMGMRAKAQTADLPRHVTRAISLAIMWCVLASFALVVLERASS
ncbi:MAG: ATP-binding cassette domain-containing protein [Planctomycetota bacterium]